MTAPDWIAAEAAADRLAQAYASDGPGIAILLLDRDGVRHARSAGLASIEHGIAFDADTPCRYASISKHFLCALLARTGLIGFDDKLGAHLALRHAIGAVPVGRALDMTGGIPDTMETLWLLGVPPTAAMDRHALLSFVQRFEATNFPPGTEVSYSNTGYRLVQAALEARGIDIAERYAEQFFAPLGLGICFPDDDTQLVANLATGYWRDGERWRVGRYGLHISASGGLASSARDLAIWASALLADRAPAQGLLATLGAVRAKADGRATGYGFGLARQSIAGHTMFGHGGSLPGYKGHFLIDPAHGAGVVVLSNSEQTEAARIATTIMHALHDCPEAPVASTILPNGLFVSEVGPYWLEHRDGVANFLGASEVLYDHGDGWATGRSAHLAMRLRMDGGDVVGQIGQVTRRFHPVAAHESVDPTWSGTWGLPGENARFSIDRGVMHAGVGPLRDAVTLQRIDGGRALVAWGGGGPWRQRVCLAFAGDEVRLVTNRSRVLRFSRVH